MNSPAGWLHTINSSETARILPGSQYKTWLIKGTVLVGK